MNLQLYYIRPYKKIGWDEGISQTSFSYIMGLDNNENTRNSTLKSF